MTTILDPENTIKDAESSEVWRQYYVDQYQLKTQIIGIDDTIVGIIKQNCQSNILLCLQYFVNMLQNKFVEVRENGFVMTTSKFRKCSLIGEWTSVPVPRIAMKLNSQFMSEYFFSI